MLAGDARSDRPSATGACHERALTAAPADEGPARLLRGCHLDRDGERLGGGIDLLQVPVRQQPAHRYLRVALRRLRNVLAEHVILRASRELLECGSDRSDFYTEHLEHPEGVVVAQVSGILRVRVEIAWRQRAPCVQIAERRQERAAVTAETVQFHTDLQKCRLEQKPAVGIVAGMRETVVRREPVVVGDVVPVAAEEKLR
ncbi:hypothetical protein GCM10009677_14180 [Sphaerisporangium rubeum]